MRFKVVDQVNSVLPSGTRCILLKRDKWNDFFEFRTQFNLYLLESDGEQVYVGDVKILQRGADVTEPPDEFEQLGETFCSLGQTQDYYDRLASLGISRAREILAALRDVALDPDIAAAFADHRGYERSLLRMAEARIAFQEAGGKFSEGAPAPPPRIHAFSFSCELAGFNAPHEISFDFPRGGPQLGRMMALVGKNGTGKTRLLAALAHVLSGLDPDRGRIEPAQNARVIALSFSAFDQFTRPRESPFGSLGASYRYYGLRRASAGGQKDRIDPDHAFERFRDSLERLARRETAREHWIELLTKAGLFRLEPQLADPFSGAGITAFLDGVRSAASGHQMLAFIATAIVESVDAGTVILFDEPELHLHPNLLSSVLRLLYDALDRLDAYAILATHSPIVLQEIPSSCVRIIRLEGRTPIVSGYERESFGENLSEIVQYAFEMGENDTSYITILRKLAETMTREEIEQLFKGTLGLGARLILREIESAPRR